MMQETPEAPLRQSGSSSSNSARSSWGFKDFDFYQKVDENVKVQTTSGGTLSILGWIAIALLAMAELRNYYAPSLREHLVVDTTLGQQLRVDINITFHALTCNEVHLDVMDIAGDNQLNVEHEMMKQRLTSDGKPIGKAGVEIIGEGPLDAPQTPLPPKYCGSCYGAETETRKCCNTCQDLINAYNAKQWNINSVLKNSTQCVRDRATTFVDVKAGEGCNVWGAMHVNKVSGNFHIAQGESIVRDGRHIHHFNPALATSYNISHTIHSLSFGTPFPDMPSNPLDGRQNVIGVDKMTGLHQYFIRVIPTVYTEHTWIGPVTTPTNQYTVSDRFRPVAIPKLDGENKPTEVVLPGIFFVYEMSPFMIHTEKDRLPWMHLCTKLCAILGGILAVLGVLDALIFRLSRLLSKKA